MNFKGHLIGGCVTGIAATACTYQMYHTPLIPVSCGAFAVIASLYPDTDTKSVPSKIFFVASVFAVIVFVIALKWLLVATIILMMLVSALAPHRGTTHTIAFAAVFCFALPQVFLGYFIASLCVSGFAGYLTHLILDRHIKLF